MKKAAPGCGSGSTSSPAHPIPRLLLTAGASHPAPLSAAIVDLLEGVKFAPLLGVLVLERLTHGFSGFRIRDPET